eukprot:jgi/Bigna1/58702/fgenesh1_kg.1_\
MNPDARGIHLFNQSHENLSSPNEAGDDLKTSEGIADVDRLRPVAITQPVGEMVISLIYVVIFCETVVDWFRVAYNHVSKLPPTNATAQECFRHYVPEMYLQIADTYQIHNILQVPKMYSNATMRGY